MTTPPTTLEALDALVQAHLAESPLEPKIVPGLSEKLYRDFPAVHFSGLKHMAESPRKYLWELTHPKEVTLPMIFGTCVHADVLEPHRLPEMIVTRPTQWKDWRTDASKEWRAAQTSLVVTEDELATVHACAESIKQHPFAAWILAGGEKSDESKEAPKELAVFRRHERTGILIKARIDAPFMDKENRQCIADIKKTVSVREWKVTNTVRDYFYDLQAAIYQWALGASGSFYIIAVEGKGPYDVDVFDLADWIDGGRDLMEQLLDRLADCIAKNDWPGVSENRQTVRVLKRPAYITRETVDLEA